MKTLTKKQLIDAISKLECSDDTPIRIWDYKKNIRDDDGDGSSEGIYEIEPSLVDYVNEWGKDEIEYYKERHDGQLPKQWIALCFDNPEFDD